MLLCGKYTRIPILHTYDSWPTVVCIGEMQKTYVFCINDNVYTQVYDAHAHACFIYYTLYAVRTYEAKIFGDTNRKKRETKYKKY